MSLILSVKEVTVGQIATNTSPQQATEDILYNSWGPYDYNKNGAVDQNQEDAIQSDIIIDGKFNMNLDYSVYGGRGSSGLDSVVAENLVSL